MVPLVSELSGMEVTTLQYQNRLREADSLAAYHNLGQNSAVAKIRPLPEDLLAINDDLSEINDVNHLLPTSPAASSPDDASDEDDLDPAELEELIAAAKAFEADPRWQKRNL